MSSVNQLNAKIKLTEMWKATNVPNYSVNVSRREANESTRDTRSITTGRLIEQGISEKSKATFINDATRAWNRAPEEIKTCKSLNSAKKAIKKFTCVNPK